MKFLDNPATLDQLEEFWVDCEAPIEYTPTLWRRFMRNSLRRLVAFGLLFMIAFAALFSLAIILDAFKTKI